MAIPASLIVDVQPRVITGGSNDLEMNGLVLTESEAISADSMVLEFSSAAAAGEYFGLDSKEYAAAQVYFTGYVNKMAAPRSFFVGRRISGTAAGWLRGAAFSGSLTDLQAVTDGSLVLSIDGGQVIVDQIDLSEATSLSNAASLIQTAVSAVQAGVTVTYSSHFRSFTVTSGSKGQASSVSCAQASSAGTDLGPLLGLTAEAGALTSSGSDALSVDQQMAAILSRSANWVSFTTLEEAEAGEILEWAAWANANYGWLYVAYTTNPGTISRDVDNDPASRLVSAGYDHTAIVYGSIEYALFIMGSVASVAWQRVNGTVTFAFKRQAGLSAYVTTEAQAAVLESKRCNYFGNFATRNAEFVFLYNGCLSASDYGFIDPYINSIWLNNRLQVALMDGLSLSGRVPYNERGYTMIRSWMMDPVNEALNNAAIEPGVSLSDAQKSALFNEAGRDITGELQTQGYYIQVLDPGTAVRARRETPVVNLWYTYGGAVQRVEVASTAVL